MLVLPGARGKKGISLAEFQIEIEDLGLSYAGAALGAQADILKGINLQLETGSFTALVGRSGAGKTSLLKCINRLHAPTRGRILLGGEDTSALRDFELRRRIGYAFQGVGLFPHMSVNENIGITPKLLGWSKPDIAARVAALLTLVDLPQDIGMRSPRALSGGQQQRVGLARALAARPHVMLLDEPFGALDPQTRETLGLAYRDLHQRLGLTTIMVTHDLEEALLLCDRIVVLDDGRIRSHATPAALVASDDPALQALLDVPRRHAERMQMLLRSGAH